MIRQRFYYILAFFYFLSFENLTFYLRYSLFTELGPSEEVALVWVEDIVKTGAVRKRKTTMFAIGTHRLWTETNSRNGIGLCRQSQNQKILL